MKRLIFVSALLIAFSGCRVMSRPLGGVVPGTPATADGYQDVATLTLQDRLFEMHVHDVLERAGICYSIGTGWATAVRVAGRDAARARGILDSDSQRWGWPSAILERSSYPWMLDVDGWVYCDNVYSSVSTADCYLMGFNEHLTALSEADEADGFRLRRGERIARIGALSVPYGGSPRHTRRGAYIRVATTGPGGVQEVVFAVWQEGQDWITDYVGTT